jgi:hypothetical protein
MPPLQSILCSRAFSFAGLALLVLLLVPAAFAAEPEIYTGRDGLAVGAVTRSPILLPASQ